MMVNQNPQFTKKELKKLRRQEKERVSRIILWSAVLALIGGTIFGAYKLAGDSSSVGEDNRPSILAKGVSSSDWVKGVGDARVVVIEYSDFQCPTCARFSPMIRQLAEEFSDRIQFVYRHFPLSQHRQAKAAAYAAEAAGRQGKFWEMHDLIFNGQSEWSDQENASEIFISYARELGLDVERFETDVDSEEVKDKVAEDYRSGAAAGVNATPTFFLNGEKMALPSNYDEFKNALERSLSSL